MKYKKIEPFDGYTTPINRGPKPRNWSGKRFARWLVIEFVGVKNNNRFWLCKCDCGNKKIIQIGGLISGQSTCCGCSPRIKHGSCGTPEYKAWNSMKNRCLNSNLKQYKNYGGRGIKVCDRWLHSFENFLADMGRRPSSKYSIDRINNDGDYEPSNCRWATTREQKLNTTKNHRVISQDKNLTITEWATELGLNRHLLYNRAAKLKKAGRKVTIEEIGLKQRWTRNYTTNTSEARND